MLNIINIKKTLQQKLKYISSNLILGCLLLRRYATLFGVLMIRSHPLLYSWPLEMQLFILILSSNCTFNGLLFLPTAWHDSSFTSNRLQILYIWAASSLVGHTMSARAYSLVLPLSKWCSTGNKNASVLPDPVGAQTIMFRSCIIAGITWIIWVCIWLVYVENIIRRVWTYLIRFFFKLRNDAFLDKLSLIVKVLKDKLYLY